jgi:hypothetical protein
METWCMGALEIPDTEEIRGGLTKDAPTAGGFGMARHPPKEGGCSAPSQHAKANRAKRARWFSPFLESKSPPSAFCFPAWRGGARHPPEEGAPLAQTVVFPWNGGFQREPVSGRVSDSMSSARHHQGHASSLAHSPFATGFRRM